MDFETCRCLLSYKTLMKHKEAFDTFSKPREKTLGKAVEKINSMIEDMMFLESDCKIDTLKPRQKLQIAIGNMDIAIRQDKEEKQELVNKAINNVNEAIHILDGLIEERCAYEGEKMV